MLLLESGHSTSSKAFTPSCLFICLVLVCFFYFTAGIQKVPLPPFHNLDFSSLPANSHRSSSPVDVSEKERLFTRLLPKKETSVWTCILLFNQCPGPVRHWCFCAFKQYYFSFTYLWQNISLALFTHSFGSPSARPKATFNLSCRCFLWSPAKLDCFWMLHITKTTSHLTEACNKTKLV